MIYIGFLRRLLKNVFPRASYGWMLDATASLEVSRFGSWLVSNRGGIGYDYEHRRGPKVLR